MKLKALYLIAIIAPALWAEPVVKETRDLSPPVDWKKSALTQEAWWPALMAEFQPEKLTFSDWKKFYSESFISKNGITEEVFKQHAKSVAENRDAVHPLSEIKKLIFISDGADDFLRVEEVIERFSDQRETKRITFLKKISTGWINWTAPADMPFDTPLLKIE
jgi:hypothetical protein